MPTSMPPSRRSGHGLKRCICTLLHRMSRLHDTCVNNMNKFSDRMLSEGAFGFRSSGCSSCSCNLRSSKNCSFLDDELADLIRAATEKSRRAGSGHMRSRSVAITRIDEDKPCDFKDCDLNLGLGLNFPRSQSCAPVRSGLFGSRARYPSFC